MCGFFCFVLLFVFFSPQNVWYTLYSTAGAGAQAHCFTVHTSLPQMPGISGYPATPGVAKSHTLQCAMVSVWSGAVLGLKSHGAQACKKEQGLKPADCSTQIPWEQVKRSISIIETDEFGTTLSTLSCFYFYSSCLPGHFPCNPRLWCLITVGLKTVTYETDVHIMVWVFQPPVALTTFSKWLSSPTKCLLLFVQKVTEACTEVTDNFLLSQKWVYRFLSQIISNFSPLLKLLDVHLEQNVGKNLLPYCSD